MTKNLVNPKSINNQIFRRLNIAAKGLYRVNNTKSTLERREAVTVGHFLLQYIKLRMLELYCHFFENFGDVSN